MPTWVLGALPGGPGLTARNLARPSWQTGLALPAAESQRPRVWSAAERRNSKGGCRSGGCGRVGANSYPVEADLCAGGGAEVRDEGVATFGSESRLRRSRGRNYDAAGEWGRDKSASLNRARVALLLALGMTLVVAAVAFASFQARALTGAEQRQHPGNRARGRQGNHRARRQWPRPRLVLLQGQAAPTLHDQRQEPELHVREQPQSGFRQNGDRSRAALQLRGSRRNSRRGGKLLYPALQPGHVDRRRLYPNLGNSGKGKTGCSQLVRITPASVLILSRSPRDKRILANEHIAEQ